MSSTTSVIYYIYIYIEYAEYKNKKKTIRTKRILLLLIWLSIRLSVCLSQRNFHLRRQIGVFGCQGTTGPKFNCHPHSHSKICEIFPRQCWIFKSVFPSVELTEKNSFESEWVYYHILDASINCLVIKVCPSVRHLMSDFCFRLFMLFFLRWFPVSFIFCVIFFLSIPFFLSFVLPFFIVIFRF